MNQSLFKRIKEILWLAFSESDERYLDLVRVGYVLAVLGAIGLAAYGVYRGADFSTSDFGAGIGMILFGGGAGIGARAKLEDGTGISEKTKGIKDPLTKDQDKP